MGLLEISLENRPQTNGWSDERFPIIDQLSSRKSQIETLRSLIEGFGWKFQPETRSRLVAWKAVR